jgi:outer membrane protein
MKRATIQVLLAVLLLALLSWPAHAQTKIATIDLRKVFDDYYKTKAADGKLKEQAGDLSKESKAYMDQYQKGTEDYKKLLDEANNQAVSAEEREKRKKAAETKLLEIKELEQTMRQFDTTSRTTLQEQRRQMRERILKEIRVVVDLKAKAAGVNLVIDSAAESVNETPVVLFNTGENDLTAAVLDQLNATAPPAPKEDASKDTNKSKK